MSNKCIADEVIREIQRGTLIDLVTECAESFGYSAQRAYETAQEQPISGRFLMVNPSQACLLYTSDAADERSSVDLGGRRIIKKKKTT